MHVCLFAGFLRDLEGAFVFFSFSAALDEALVVKFYALETGGEFVFGEFWLEVEGEVSVI